MSIDLVLAALTSGLRLLAEAGAPAAGAAADGGSGAGAGAEAQPGGPSILVLIAGMFFLYYFIVLLPGRREKAKETALMSGLKKNDRVITIGGIHATVANVTEKSDVVTLRIDENGNTRIKVNRSAIAKIVSDKANSDNPKDADSDTKDS